MSSSQKQARLQDFIDFKTVSNRYGRISIGTSNSSIIVIRTLKDSYKAKPIRYNQNVYQSLKYKTA